MVLLSFQAQAHQNGIVAEGCTGCHGDGKEPKVTLTSSSPTVSPGQTIRLTVSIEAINGPKGGLYFEATPGVGVVSLVAGQPTKLTGDNGLTHTAPKTAEGATVDFLIDWTAPATPGGVDFNVWALSANGDGRSSGDAGGYAFLSMVFGCSGTTFYPDHDNDGFGNSQGEYTMACVKPAGFSPLSTDCDDNDEHIYPGAPEICNGRDDNCNQMIDEGLPISTYCEDKDGDGHGVKSANTMTGCAPAKGYGLCDNDCDDNDPTVYPTATEVCNNRDDNCNGTVDEGARVICGVGWCRRYGDGCNSSLCTPGKPRPEECNAFDDDCDGVIDNGENLCGEGKSCVNGECIDGDAPPGTSTSGGQGDPGGTTASTGSTGTGSAAGAASSSSGGASCSVAPLAPGPGKVEILALLMVAGSLERRRRARAIVAPGLGRGQRPG